MTRSLLFIRFLVFSLLIIITGCVASSPPAKGASTNLVVEPAGKSISTSRKAANDNSFRALDGSNGHLITINERLGFVVIDYSLNAVPPIGNRLIVMRGGQSVGVLQLTGPVFGTNAAAEIISGSPALGDTVVPELAAH